MKRLIGLAALGLVISLNAYCFELQPVSKIRFYCSESGKEMMVSDGTAEQIVIGQLVDWSSGLPRPGCTQKMVRDITAKGYFCDGHFLANYKGEEEQMGTVEACEEALAAKPRITWN